MFLLVWWPNVFDKGSCNLVTRKKLFTRNTKAFFANYITSVAVGQIRLTGPNLATTIVIQMISKARKSITLKTLKYSYIFFKCVYVFKMLKKIKNDLKMKKKNMYRSVDKKRNNKIMCTQTI